jgi:N-terminal acetyltransferase B complex non-catalytic subunit
MLQLYSSRQFSDINKHDPIAVRDIRDLRFMANICANETRVKALRAAWAEPPEHLQDVILRRHRDDLRTIIERSLRRTKLWPELEAHCRETITEKVTHLERAGTSKLKSELRELCAWNGEVWDNLVTALEHSRSGTE